MTNKEIYNNLVALAESMKMSLRELAQRAGLGQEDCQCLNDRRPSTFAIAKILNACDITISEFAQINANIKKSV